MIERAVKIVKTYLPIRKGNPYLTEYEKNDICKACEFANVDVPPMDMRQNQFIILAALRILNKAMEVGVLWESL